MRGPCSFGILCRSDGQQKGVRLADHDVRFQARCVEVRFCRTIERDQVENSTERVSFLMLTVAETVNGHTVSNLRALHKKGRSLFGTVWLTADHVDVKALSQALAQIR